MTNPKPAVLHDLIRTGEAGALLHDDRELIEAAARCRAAAWQAARLFDRAGAIRPGDPDPVTRRATRADCRAAQLHQAVLDLPARTLEGLAAKASAILAFDGDLAAWPAPRRLELDTTQAALASLIADILDLAGEGA